MAVVAFSLLLAACVLSSARSFGPETDQIRLLPGAPKDLPFQQYSGYVTVNHEHGRNLFYWLVESQSDPSKAPLVLWLNGGPGCSSLAALLTEHGPFVTMSSNELQLNDFSWNKVANVIYLESPSGVGFSFSNTTQDYKNPNDETSANDIVAFLEQFMKAYPQYQGRQFFISGESYGGHYVPTTAKAIVDFNAKHAEPQHINLKGILVGNAWTLPEADNLGVIQTWLAYNLIRQDTGDTIVKHCNFSNMLPIKKSVDDDISSNSLDDQECSAALQEARNEIGNIDMYNIYKPVCREKEVSSRTAFLSKLAQSAAPLRAHAQQDLALRRAARAPCEMQFASEYLNSPSVQQAIHAERMQWSECNMNINGAYNRVDFLRSMLPVHRYLMAHGVIVHIYSGDIDAVVPTHGTRNWIGQLVASGAIKVSEAWAPWTDSAGQVGGYTTQYNGGSFTFTTVHGAGHMVPTAQPRRALDLLNRFLSDFK